jgi:superfamily II DNA helicase RecQ
MAGESPVITVIGTGGGKSLLFMLSAFYSGGGVSVIIIPLIVLRQDMRKRCKDIKIIYREWNSRQPADAARIMLVTPESAVSERFRTFLNRMKAT